MKKLQKSLLVLCAAAISFSCTYAKSAKIQEKDLVIPTFDVAAPDLNPLFFTGRTYQGAAGHIYPYPMYDVLTDNRHDKAYNAVYLENDYTEVCVIPELGGRILSAMDKETNYDFFYRQHVVKPALIGMIGAWMSGGVEWNIPHHHRASSHLPVDYKMVENSDGSKTLWIGESELRDQLKWVIGLTIYPNRSYVEAKVRVFNNTPYMRSFLYWANVSVHCNNDYKVIFPPKTQFGTQHAKNEFVEWPVGKSRYGGMDCKDMDMTMWKNYPKACSIFAWNFDEDFLAGYDYGKEGGTIHVANRHLVGGKKFFLWGNCSTARMWRKMLTEVDGDYLELMVGAFSDNQPDYSWIAPGETKEFKQIWYPAIKIGGVKNANEDAAVNVDRTSKDKVLVGFNATTEFDDAKILVTDKGKVIFEQEFDISPKKPFVTTIEVPQSTKDEDICATLFDKNGKELVSYQKEILPDVEKPKTVVPPTNPKDYKTVEELYLTGLRIEQFHNATLNAMDYYKEALSRDPQDVRTNTAVGIRYAKNADFDKALKHLKTASDRVTKNYTVARDVEPIYYTAVIQQKLGSLKEAKDNYWKATWRPEFKVPSFYALAQIACVERDYKVALEMIDSALQFNSKNVKAMVLKAYILRKLDKKSDAQKILANAEKIDQLDYFLNAERGFLNDNDKALTPLEKNMGNPIQNVLDTANMYGNAGGYSEAVDVLKAYASSGDLTTMSPLVYYYMGYYLGLDGEQKASLEAYQRASKMASDYCFPFRAEEVAVLENAIKANPQDARANYYLGNLLYYFDRPQQAIAAWEKSVALEPTLGVAWRNLGFAFDRSNKPQKAVEAYEKAISVNPSDARYYTELDKLYDSLGKSAKDRLAMMEKNSDSVAKRDDAIERQIELYIIDGQYDKALSILQKRHFHVWEGGGKIHSIFVDACLQRALSKLAKGDKKGALADFKLGSTYPDNLEVGQAVHGDRLPQSLYLQAQLLDSMGDKSAAVELYKQIVKFPSRGAGNYLNFYRAMAFKQLGDNQESTKILKVLSESAERGLKTAAKLDFFEKFGEQLNKQKRDAQNYYLLGLVAMANGDKEKAKSDFAQAIKLDSNHIWAKHYLKSVQ